MSDVYGNLKLINGQILNLTIEELNNIPEFTPIENGRLIRINDNLYYNNGENWKNIQFSNNSNDPLLDTLGRNWINSDLSFNPTPFNELTNISGLTSNDSLFNVISQLDNAISSTHNISLEDLNDVSMSNKQTGQVIFYNGTNFSNIDLNTLADHELELTTSKLKDVLVVNGNYSLGDILVFSSDKTKFVNRKIFFQYTGMAANTTFLVNHNLGVKHCMVQAINLQTDQLITSDFNVSYIDTNQFRISFTNPVSVRVLVAALNIT